MLHVKLTDSIFKQGSLNLGDEMVNRVSVSDLFQALQVGLLSFESLSFESVEKKKLICLDWLLCSQSAITWCITPSRISELIQETRVHKCTTVWKTWQK